MGPDLSHREGVDERMTDHQTCVARPANLLAASVSLLLALSAEVLAAQVDRGLEPAGSCTCRSELEIEIVEHRVSLRANGLALRRVLEEIASRTGIELELEDPLDRPSNVSFEDLFLPEALDRLLEGRSYLLRHVDDASGRQGVSWLWVMAQGAKEAAVDPADAVARPDPDESGLERLRQALADHDPKTRLRAVTGLEQLTGSEAAMKVLATTARIDDNASVREEAVHALGELGDVAARIELEQALLDPESRVREAALHSLVDLGGEDSARALASALNDEDPALREQAVYALGDIGGEAALSILQRALSDEQGRVWQAAIEVLEDLSAEDGRQ